MRFQASFLNSFFLSLNTVNTQIFYYLHLIMIMTIKVNVITALLCDVSSSLFEFRVEFIVFKELSSLKTVNTRISNYMRWHWLWHLKLIWLSLCYEISSLFFNLFFFWGEIFFSSLKTMDIRIFYYLNMIMIMTIKVNVITSLLCDVSFFEFRVYLSLKNCHLRKQRVLESLTILLMIDYND